MKNKNFFFVVTLLFALAVSCGNPPNHGNDSALTVDTEEYRHSLPGYVWLENGANYHKEEYVDSIFHYYNNQIKDKEYEKAANYLMAYGQAVGGSMAYDSLFFNTSKNFYDKYHDKISGESQSYLGYYLGMQNYYNHNLEGSFEWLKKAIAIEPESKSHNQIIGFSNFSIAQNYGRIRDFENAEKYLIQALRIFEEVGDETNQGTVYLLLFSIYNQNSAYTEAEKNLEKGLRIVKKNNNKRLTFSSYSLYVNLNISRADTLRAIKYIDSMALQAESYTDINNYHKALLNQLIAFKHIAQREEAEALEYLKISREMTDQSNSADLQMRTLFKEIMFAEIFDKPLANPHQVENFFNEIATEEVPNTQFMVQLGHGLFDYYTKIGDYKKANTYATFLLENSDKESVERINGKLFELERKFKTERKEKTILLQESQLETQRNTIILLGGGAVLLILIFALFVVWNKNRNIIREKALSDNFTSQLLSKTEDDRKRIASDLHDSVSNELINLRHALESNNYTLKAKIDTMLEEVRNISRNLSPTLFDKLGLKQSIEQLTERAQNLHHFLLSSEIDYSASLPSHIELQLYRIIQEATTNIMKHAEAMAGKITIHEDSQFVYAEIKDNGKGFEVEKMLEKGNCFGLLNITERTKFINGTVTFKSDSNGSIIKISIPKPKE